MGSDSGFSFGVPFTDEKYGEGIKYGDKSHYKHVVRDFMLPELLNNQENAKLESGQDSELNKQNNDVNIVSDELKEGEEEIEEISSDSVEFLSPTATIASVNLPVSRVPPEFSEGLIFFPKDPVRISEVPYNRLLYEALVLNHEVIKAALLCLFSYISCALQSKKRLGGGGLVGARILAVIVMCCVISPVNLAANSTRSREICTPDEAPKEKLCFMSEGPQEENEFALIPYSPRITHLPSHIPSFLSIFASTEKCLVSMNTIMTVAPSPKPHPMASLNTALVVVVVFMFLCCTPCSVIVLVLIVVAYRCLKDLCVETFERYQRYWCLQLTLRIIRWILAFVKEQAIFSYDIATTIGTICIWVVSRAIDNLPRLKGPLNFTAPLVLFYSCALLLRKTVALCFMAVLVFSIGFLYFLNTLSLVHSKEAVNNDSEPSDEEFQAPRHIDSDMFVDPLISPIQTESNATLHAAIVFSKPRCNTLKDSECPKQHKISVVTGYASSTCHEAPDNDHPLLVGCSVQSSVNPYSFRETVKYDDTLPRYDDKNSGVSLDGNAVRVPGDDLKCYDISLSPNQCTEYSPVFGFGLPTSILQPSISSVRGGFVAGVFYQPSFKAEVASRISSAAKDAHHAYDILTHEALTHLTSAISINVRQPSIITFSGAPLQTATYRSPFSSVSPTTTAISYNYLDSVATLMEHPHDLTAGLDLASVSSDYDVLKSLRHTVLQRGEPDGIDAQELFAI